MTGTRFALLACLLALSLASACGGNEAPSKIKAPQPSGLAQLANPTDPGIDFAKTVVGLQSKTLDFVGGEPLGLSGAKAASIIFFAADENGVGVIYSRNLESLERKQITTVKNLVQGSLIASSNGEYIVYCKKRFIDRYIDDPDMKYPEVLSLPYLYDIAKGEEIELFDFRQKDWLPFRTTVTELSVSPNGQRVCLLTYNIDRMMLDRQLQEWLYYAETYNNPPEELTEQDLSDLEDLLRMLFGDSRLSPLLKEQGIDPFAKGAITKEEQDAVAKLQQLMMVPEPAMLVYENGESRILPITVVEGYDNHQHSVIAMGNERVLLGVQQRGSNPTEPRDFFELNMESGETSLVGSFTGMPSTMELDPEEQNLLVILNPISEETQLLESQTNLVTIPLDGSEITTIELPADFFGNANMSTDGKHILAQTFDTSGLFIVDTESNTMEKIAQLVGPLDSVFINDTGSIAVYIDSGIVGEIALVAAPEKSDTWIDDSHFASYETLVRDFIVNAGYEFPVNARFVWEERKGIGAHEVACAVSKSDEIGAMFLARYSVDKEGFVSIFFPTGNKLTRTTLVSVTEFDFYDCQQIAEDMLIDIGWLNPETWQYYQPGTNPLYDARSDSFIIIYRDGYFLGDEANGNWVTNDEVTLRVNASNGAVEEMTLSNLDEVQDQSIEISPDRAAFMIKNQEDFAVPANAPLELNTEGYRLVIGTQKQTAWGPALYNSKMIPRLCYEIDGYLMPENELVITALVDVTTGEVLGQINFMPTSVDEAGQRLGNGT